MAFDTKAWLKSLGFTDEKVASLSGEFEPLAGELEKGQLRLADYSRHMNELNTSKTALSAANDKLTADMAEWASLTAAEKEAATQLRTDLDSSREQIFKLTTKIQRLAEDNGIDPKTVLDGEPVPPKKVDAPVPFDPTPLHQQIGGIADYMLTLNAELPAIAQEHYELTGERLDTRAFVDGIRQDLKANKTQNLDPVKRWEAQFGIADKRATKATKAIDDRIVAARAEERAAVLSEQALPNTHIRPGTHAPVFKTGVGESKLQRPQPSQRMTGAVSALASGKYRTQPGARP